ncbi:SDR family NAD(P)-dependent oxidoreductase, partial [Streptomyces sp. NPDC127574]|uniref:SDR family NAD(P)-dependent oxidoreductase n=1 Tax=Streptomyces sp. NPDC127574 TaxID=3345401 RepID=UPI003631C194
MTGGRSVTDHEASGRARCRGHGWGVTNATGGSMVRRWLVTGCSSGLGQALAEAAAQAGDMVAVTARSVARLEDLRSAWPEQIVP